MKKDPITLKSYRSNTKDTQLDNRN